MCREICTTCIISNEGHTIDKTITDGYKDSFCEPYIQIMESCCLGIYHKYIQPNIKPLKLMFLYIVLYLLHLFYRMIVLTIVSLVDCLSQSSELTTVTSQSSELTTVTSGGANIRKSIKGKYSERKMRIMRKLRNCYFAILNTCFSFIYNNYLFL